MKKISIGGWIVGVLDLLMALFLILMFAVGYDDINMNYVFDDPKTLVAILCLLSGSFKLLGIIIIWAKKKIGFWLYTIGTLILIFFLGYASKDYSFSHSDEVTPLLFMYTAIVLELVFIYIMSKAIKDVEPVPINDMA